MLLRDTIAQLVDDVDEMRLEGRGSNVVASVRGRGMSMRRLSTMRPGRRLMT
jgi:hypothetical protein